MSELRLERACVALAKSRAWLCFKLTSPGTRGLPDRLLIRAGRVVFVEFKAPGTGRLSPFQQLRIAELRREGMEVYVVTSRDAFEEAIGP